MAPDPQRTQEQSIKARKHLLFDADSASVESGPRASFEDCLKVTPADPLSTPIKGLLWTVGTVVVLLLLAALATMGTKPKPKPSNALAPTFRAAERA